MCAEFFLALVSARVNFDVLPTFEDMSSIPMTEATIRAELPPADFGVSAVCVGAPVESDEQDVQEEDMEEEGMDEVGQMVDSDGQESSEEEVAELTGSTTGAGGDRRVRIRRPSSRVSGDEWS